MISKLLISYSKLITVIIAISLEVFGISKKMAVSPTKCYYISQETFHQSVIFSHEWSCDTRRFLRIVPMRLHSNMILLTLEDS